MIGEKRQLATNEPVEFEDGRKITDHLRGSIRIHPTLIKENWRMCTCNRRLCPKISPSSDSIYIISITSSLHCVRRCCPHNCIELAFYAPTTTCRNLVCLDMATLPTWGRAIPSSPSLSCLKVLLVTKPTQTSSLLIPKVRQWCVHWWWEWK